MSVDSKPVLEALRDYFMDVLTKPDNQNSVVIMYANRNDVTYWLNALGDIIRSAGQGIGPAWRIEVNAAKGADTTTLRPALDYLGLPNCCDSHRQGIDLDKPCRNASDNQ